MENDISRGTPSPGVSIHLGLLKSASLLSGVRLVGGALLFASQILLARWMGAEAFGIYSFAWAVVAVFAVVVGLGLPTTSVRFIARYRMQGAGAQLAGLMRWAHRVTLSASIVLSGSGILLIGFFFADSPYSVTTQLALMAVPVIAWLHLDASYARAFDWMAFSAVAEQLVRPLLLIGFGVLLMGALADGAGAEVFALVCLAAYLLATAGQYLALRRRLRRHAEEEARIDDRGAWIGVGVGIWVLNSAQVARMNVDPLVVGLMLEPADVGVYTAAVRTATLVAFVMMVTSIAAQPRISALHSASTPGELSSFFRFVQLGSFLATLGIGLMLAALGRPVLDLFGAEYVAAYPALLILIAGHVAAAAFGPVTSMLIMTGGHAVAAAIQVCSVAFSIVLLAALVPRFGLEGAAAAAVASLVLLQMFSWSILHLRSPRMMRKEGS